MQATLTACTWTDNLYFYHSGDLKIMICAMIIRYKYIYTYMFDYFLHGCTLLQDEK